MILIDVSTFKCRHVLNAKESWSTHDGTFHSEIFFQNILDLFDDENWAKETLSWWAKYVLVITQNVCVKNQNPGVIPISPSTFGSKLLTDHLIQKREGRTGVDGIRPKSTSSRTSAPEAPSRTRCSGPNQTSRTPSELLGGTPPLREKDISRLLTESSESATSERRRTGPSSINAATRKV